MFDLVPATYQDFLKYAEQGNVIPVTKTIAADLHTPVSAYLKIQQRSPYSFLLESLEGNEKIARYSFLGCNPHLIARGRGDVMEVTIGNVTETQQVNMFEGMRRYMGRYLPPHFPDMPPFTGGVVGYLAYDAVRWFEDVPCKNPDDLQTDDGVMMFFSTVLAFDHVAQQIKIIVNVFSEGRTGGLEDDFQRALAEIEEIENLLNSAALPPRKRKRTEAPMLKSTLTKDQFQHAVERAKEQIAAGEVFQVVLSQRFEFNVATHPFQIYRALRMVTPAPYMYYLSINDTVVMGASHEMLARCTGRRIDCRTAFGSRQRGKTDIEDDLLGAELTADENVIPGHVMLVDATRDDMGKVADYGSIEVVKLMGIEFASQTVNMVSAMKGILRVGCDRFDALSSCFPSHGISGVPKIPAMKLIDELEPTRRGIYGGTIMYLDYTGNLDSCVAKQSVTVKGNRAFVQAGATITTGSMPEKEFVETVNRVRVLIRAIEIAEKEM